MPTTIRALRYASRFRCIADRCEDTCCAGLQVRLTRPDVDRLEAAFAASEAAEAKDGAPAEAKAGEAAGANSGEAAAGDRTTLNALRTSLDTEAPPEGYAATFKMTEQGACAHLDTDLLCSVAKRLGEPALPEVCSLFPRTFSFDGDVLEMSLSLACPEAARQCLLHDDALEETSMPPEALPRLPTRPSGEGAAQDPYLSPYEAVHAAGVALLSNTRHPLPIRLLALVQLGEETRNRLYKGTEALDEPEARDALEAALREGSTPAALDAAAACFSGATPFPRPVQGVLGLLAALDERGHPRFGALWSAVLERLHVTAKTAFPKFGEEGGPAFFDAMAAVYRAERDHQAPRVGATLDAALGRACLASWYRDWYVRSDSLAAHGFKLLLFAVAARVLLVGHPDVLAVSAATEPGAPYADGHEEALGNAAVWAVQVLSRHVERDLTVLETLERALSPEQLGVTGAERGRLFAALL